MAVTRGEGVGEIGRYFPKGTMLQLCRRNTSVDLVCSMVTTEHYTEYWKFARKVDFGCPHHKHNNANYVRRHVHWLDCSNHFAVYMASQSSGCALEIYTTFTS